jgi:hypothetical protein
MTADPIVVLGVLLAFLRRTTQLGPVDSDDLWTVVELVDRLLRRLGVESEPHPAAGLMLSTIAAAPNARRSGCWQCQHGTGPGVCEVCPTDEHEEVPPWRPRPSPRWTISGSRSRQALTARRDSRRPAGRLR